MEQFSHVNLYLFIFLIFCIKKISSDSTPLTQKELCPKKVHKSLFFEPLILAVSHSGDSTPQKICMHPFQQHVVVVTMDHRSSLDSSTQYS